MKKKLISMLIAALMFVSLFGITPALAAGSAVVTFSGPDTISPGQTYTYYYTLNVKGACAANANIAVGGSFEKVSGGDNLFYDTIPNNTVGTVSGSVTVRVKSDAAVASTGSIYVLTDESKCSELVFDASGNVTGDPVTTTVTGSLSVRVGPPMPVVSSVTSWGDRLRVKWNAVTGANAYQVFRSTSANGPYTWLVNTLYTTFDDIGLPFKTTYYYKIRAYYQNASDAIFSDISAYSSGVIDGPMAPAAPTVTTVDFDKLKVDWSTSAGANAYQVWRSSSANGPYIWVLNTSATSYTDSGLATGTTYYYKIRAYHQTASAAYFSNDSASGSGVTKAVGAPAAPTVTTMDFDKLKVQWSTTENANAYQVWRSTSANGPYTWVLNTADTSYTDSELSYDSTYFYKIKAYYQTTSAAYFSNDSTYGSGVTKTVATPEVPTATTLDFDKLKVQWSTTENANAYQVWRSTSAGGPYTWVLNTLDTSYTDSGLSIGTTYYYKIRAYYQTKSAAYFSSDSAYGSATTKKVNAPAAPTVTVLDYGRMKVQWSTSENANAYQVWRSTSANGPYTWVLNTADTSYTDSGLAYSTTYYYKIRAYYQTASAAYFSNDSAYGAATTKGVGTPTAPTVTVLDYGRLKVDWSTAENANAYQVWRSTTATGPYTWVLNTLDTSYTDNGLAAGTTYYYKIRAYYQTASAAYFSSDSAYGTETTKGVGTPAAPTVTVLDYGRLKVQWSTTDNANAYQVWRSTSAFGPYTWVLNTADTSFTDNGLAAGTTYYYKIRAYYQTASAAYFSSDSAYGTGTTKGVGTPAAPAVTTLDYGRLKVDWSTAENANAYQVWRSTSAGGTYTWVLNTLDTSYTDSGLAAGTTYYYKIRAYYQTGSAAYFSSDSAYGTGTTKGIGAPAAPRVTMLDYDRLKVDWSTAENANAYQVWRSTSAGGTYTWVLNTLDTSYTDSGLAAGTTYYYKIRAYNQTGSAAYFSSDSAYGSGSTKGIGTPAAPTVTTLNPGQLKIQWSAAQNANAYQVWRSTSADGSYTWLTNTGDTSYTDSGLTAGTTYYYRIKAYYQTGSAAYFSTFSAYGTGISS